MTNGAVIAHTHRVAEQLKKAFPGDPAGELGAWLRIAHQREAMVTRIYGMSELSRRISEDVRFGAAGVTAKAIQGIWAQEEAHTRLLSAIRSVARDPLPALREIQGKLEGEVTRGASSGGLLARIAIAIGAVFEQIPAFAAEIDAMSLREFFAFCEELEATAASGYERMLELATAGGADDTESNPVFQLPYELTRILVEERYHAGIFACSAHWLDRSGTSFRELPDRQCVAQLHGLAREYLDLSVARSVLRRTRRSSRPSERWISDGGLATLFSEYTLEVPVAADAEATTALA